MGIFTLKVDGVNKVGGLMAENSLGVVVEW